MRYNKLIVCTDVGARGNPGPAGIGAVFYDENKNKIAEISKYIGIATNNQAEYRAVISALEKAKTLKVKELEFYCDSELVVKQLKREYKVKNKELALLFVKAYNLILNYKKVSFTHIYREKNKEADKLANNAMDTNV